MGSHAKSRAELKMELEEQLAALRLSCESFDAGRLWEAKRLAATVHILLHDGGRRTVSLLTQLGLRDRTRFLASGPPINERNLLAEMPLVIMKLATDGASYLPVLNDSPMPPRWLPFSRWWDEAVLRDQDRRSLSRKNLVFSLRDQDGGAHADATLSDEAYASISRRNGAGWMFAAPGQSPIDLNPGPHLATMRQIAWEVEQVFVPLVGSAR